MIPISAPVINIPGRTSSAKNEILFQAALPALGFNTYYFQVKSKTDVRRKRKSPIRVTRNEACILQNQVMNRKNKTNANDFCFLK